MNDRENAQTMRHKQSNEIINTYVTYMHSHSPRTYEPRTCSVDSDNSAHSTTPIWTLATPLLLIYMHCHGSRQKAHNYQGKIVIGLRRATVPCVHICIIPSVRSFVATCHRAATSRRTDSDDCNLIWHHWFGCFLANKYTVQLFDIYRYISMCDSKVCT